jgi:hypothetical protein
VRSPSPWKKRRSKNSCHLKPSDTVGRLFVCGARLPLRQSVCAEITLKKLEMDFRQRGRRSSAETAVGCAKRTRQPPANLITSDSVRSPSPPEEVPMLRRSTLIAALILIASATVGATTAQAVVCSYDVCVSHCFTAGGKFCLRGCDRRIARRQTSGLCPWYGNNWPLGQ